MPFPLPHFQTPVITLVKVSLLALLLTGCGEDSSNTSDSATATSNNVSDSTNTSTSGDSVTTNTTKNSNSAVTPTASNSSSNIASPSGIVIVPPDPIDEAIRTGNPTLLPADRAQLEKRILSTINTEETASITFLEAIYANNSVTYDAGRHSQFFTSTALQGFLPLVTGTLGTILAAASVESDQRRAAFGSNILRTLNDGGLASYQQPMENVIQWLLNANTLAAGERHQIRFMLTDDTTVARSKLWLETHFSNIDVMNCNVSVTLNTCAGEADLLITGSETNFTIAEAAAALDIAKSNTASLLYIHLRAWNSTTLTPTVLSYFDLSMEGVGGPGNFFRQDSASWTSYQEMIDEQSQVKNIKTMVQHFTDNSFSFDISSCTNSGCGAVTQYDTEYANAATTIRNMLANFDRNGRDIFSETGLELEKMLVLLGDQYRKSIVYPMDISATETGEFLRAYYADHSVYNRRSFNPVQTDLGNFSRTDFSHITPTNKTVHLTSRERFRSAGVYALPGQTVTVRRTDSSTSTTTVFVNSMRSAATKEFGNNTYNRPKYLQSTATPIAPNETISLTSPYGGPINIGFSDLGNNVTFEFSNVGEHPYWRTTSDDAAFAQALTDGHYDWAEIATEQFEVHSQLEKMRTTVSNPNWSTGSVLANHIKTYIHDHPHVLSGFQGDGIASVNEIVNFAATHNLTVTQNDIIKHMNADQATCGYGCSGNPYDAFWSFSPLGHGDLHELGHGLERGRFKFNGFDGHATTNFYSYYSKSLYHASTGQAHSCQSLPFSSLYATLQASQLEADPFAYMQAQNLRTWSQGVLIVIQMMMAAEDEMSLINGWHLLARLHLIEREFNTAVRSETAWLAKRNDLGFDEYSHAEAQALDNNDFLLLAVGHATALDFQDFYDLWGLSASAVAKTRTTNKMYTPVSKRFYLPPSEDAYCVSLNQPRHNL